MNRNLELIKEILEIAYRTGANQRVGTAESIQKELKCSGDLDVINYHMTLCHDAGFVTGYYYSAPKSSSPDRISVERLAWAGHEYLGELEKI